MQESFDSDKLYELNQTAEKLIFLSSCVMDEHFDESADTFDGRMNILYGFSHSKNMYKILYDYIIKMKNQLSEL